MTTATPEGAVRAGPRQWLGLSVLALPTLLLSMDLNILFLGLPHLSADLDAGPTQQLWITDIYGFMVAGFLVTMGTLGDRIGHRRLCLIGASVFAAASVVAAYSPSAATLIAARAALGVAGAALLPSTMALIRIMFTDPKQLAMAIAIWATGFTAGAAIGPPVGGALLTYFWWGSVFLLAVPVMAVVLVAGPMVLPEHRSAEPGRLDALSIVLTLLTILPVIWGLKEIVKVGAAVMPVVAIIAGIAFGVMFVRRQRSMSAPLLDVGLFGLRTLRVAVVIGLVNSIIQSGTLFVVSLQLQMVFGLSALAAGLHLVPPAIALIASINVVPHLAERIRPAYLASAGLLIAAVGQILLAQVASTGGTVLLTVALSVVYLGIGPVAALVPNMIMSAAPPERAGGAASIMQTNSELGLALGIAFFGTLSAAVYSAAVTVGGLSDVVAPRVRAGITGAVEEASRLPSDQADALLTNARDAFTSGLHVNAWVCAGLLVALAVLSLCVLAPRDGSDTSDDESTPSTESAVGA